MFEYYLIGFETLGQLSRSDLSFWKIIVFTEDVLVALQCRGDRVGNSVKLNCCNLSSEATSSAARVADVLENESGL